MKIIGLEVVAVLQFLKPYFKGQSQSRQGGKCGLSVILNVFFSDGFEVQGWFLIPVFVMAIIAIFVPIFLMRIFEPFG